VNAPRGGQSSRKRRSSGQRRDSANDLWRPVPTPDEPGPITPAADPKALLESLGQPPLGAHSTTAEHYLATVLERAAALATALAASADLLAKTDED
jgi:hypothetical protein